MTEPADRASEGDRRLRILYLVPDLTDPAVARRLSMFQAGGADVRLAGFHRKPWSETGGGATPMGQTQDADMGQRMRAVALWLLQPLALKRLAEDCDVIVARNLEMLILGFWTRLLKANRPGLVFECLDIHTMMLGQGVKSRALRGLEGVFLKGCRRIMVSSPAFISAYFAKVHHPLPPSLLVENKMLALEAPPRPVRRARIDTSEGGWTIGWFGMIRCRRSLEMLKALTASSDRVNVVIRGRPTAAVFPDFITELAGQDRIRFEGAYRADELQALYEAVDFVWTMDFYEAGQNSAWLLPNRLYEGGAFNRPALAQAGVQTAVWLQQQDTGVTFDDPDSQLAPFFSSLTRPAYDGLCKRAEVVPRQALICDRADCVALVDALRA